MGSVTIILVPFLLVAVFIAQFFLGITGLDVSKVTLPYDPEKGLVWEYDNKNDPYIKLEEVKIEGDEQIFCFKSRKYSNDEDYVYGCGYMMDLIFADENGNIETYYATTRNVNLGRVKIWAEEEVCVYNYTATAKKVYDDSEWDLGFGASSDCSEYIVYAPEMLSSPESFTFTVVYEKGTAKDDIIWVNFCNKAYSNNHYQENHRLKLDFSGDEAKLLEEKFWSTDELYGDVQ